MSQAPPTVEAPPQPVMRTTQYDKASAGMIAAVAGLLGLTALLVAVWFTNRLPAPPEPVPIEIVEMPGGFEDGEPDESLELESPEEEVPDPAIAETTDEQSQIEEMLETIVELSDSASQEVDTIESESSKNTGQVGSASGTGKRPLGMGGGGKGGFPREQRWRIKFDDGDLETYAKQLDFFKSVRISVPGTNVPTSYNNPVSGTSYAPSRRGTRPTTSPSVSVKNKKGTSGKVKSSSNLFKHFRS